MLRDGGIFSGRGLPLALLGVLFLHLTSGVAAVRYVAPGGSHVAPFTNWVGAATNIQAAVDAADPGDTVLVSNGVYDTGGSLANDGGTNRVSITNAIAVRSVNGPEVTTIKGAGPMGAAAVRCVYLVANAELSGFTLTDGYALPGLPGGGVLCEGSALVTNCLLTGNSAYYGAGSYSGRFINCTFSQNVAIVNGGGSYYSALSNCILTGNSAGSGGGSSYGALNNCVLSSNSASTGGGSYNSALSNCVLTGNSASSGGGAAYGVLTRCMLSSNSASTGGGSYWGSLNNCTLAYNSAVGNYGHGGGSANSTLNGCVLSHNSTYYGGGGSYGGTLSNCVLADNLALYGGGSYYGTLNNCVLSGNSDSGANSSTLNNCALVGNTAYHAGGGAYNCTLNNCTLTGNSAGSTGGGSVDSVLRNCISYFNTAPNGENYGYGSSISQSCTTPLPTGPGNIAADPAMASAYHLSVDSPCTGAGSNTFANGTDIDGETWITPPSMGCDELHPGAITGNLGVAMTVSAQNVAPNAVVDLAAHITGRVTRSLWDFGDGTVASNSPYISHSYAATGFYSVVLTAVNEDFPLGVSATTTLHVLNRTTHYVSLSNPTPVPPFTSWATAATNIQDALDAASVAGAEIFVSNGVYSSGGRAVFGSMTNRVAITNALRVQSVNGPEVTIIEGAGPNGDAAVRCAYVGADAFLSGFTLTNGHTRSAGRADYYKERSGGGAWCEASAVVSNCVLSGNFAWWAGAGSLDGTLNNCTLTGNRSTNENIVGSQAQSSAGGSYGGTLNFCTLSDNTAFSGGGSYGGTLNNCFLFGNTVAGSGGGSEGSVLNHCLLYGNAAGLDGGASGSCTLNDCTVVGNSSAGSGGGSDHSTLNNCIVYFNFAPTYSNHSASTLNYSCTSPLPTNGEANIADDPLFEDLSGTNLHLRPVSPCVNAGLFQAGLTNELDLEGHPRVLGGAVDMGAYEFAFEGGVRVALAGAMAGSVMRTNLNGALGTDSPYTVAPRIVPAIPSNAVDWVLVQVRTDLSNAPDLSRSYFLRSDGAVMDETGNTSLLLAASKHQYLVVQHRDHLTIASPTAVLTNRLFNYDFTTSAAAYYGGTNAAVEVSPGVWAMRAGDVDGDGAVSPADEMIRATQE